ncbi:MAG: filamentous hemagglutinin N-terminal domain-containing protein [Gammaproteobacteria bacterium]|nr:filamentous hemagglutinin N-terminal domain-containing protein [Gammaproteobacteria bacterium]
MQVNMAAATADQARYLMRRRAALRCALWLAAGIVTLPSAIAGPDGGQVVGGSGSISQSGANTTINQTTQNMAIDWQSYNVNVNERVQYIQPNASSVSLNRILSQNGSTIAGRIDANGQVILVNPNGIFFTPTSIINVGGIIASGLDIQPADFMNGNYIFDEVLGTDGTVINSGIINASLGGNVALIGKQVKNDGLISANLGTVTLAAGKQAVLTFDQGGLLGVRVSKEILQDELGVDPAVLNSGEINAEGGRVLLTASISRDVFSRAVNTGGLESATSVVVHDDGSFTLGGGADVINTGRIDTSTIEQYMAADAQNVGRIILIGENVTSSGELLANAENGNGGEIELHAQNTTLLTENSITSARSETNGQGGVVKVLGDNVGLFDQSVVDASGANGGGEILIGGDQEGNNALIPNAEFIYLSEASRVFADALDNGNGGKLITFAANTARIYGELFARGGINGGDGGFIETSGLVGFQIIGSPDASSPQGEAGSWLIDPYNITVTGAANNVTTGSPFTAMGENATLRAFDISNALVGGVDVIIRTRGGAGPGNGDITFAADGDIDYDGSGSRTLTVDAAGDITFEAGSEIVDRQQDNNPGNPDRLNMVLEADGAVIVETAGNGEAAASIITEGGSFTVGSAADPVASFTNNGTVDTSGAFNQDGGDITINTAGAVISTGLNANGGNTGLSNNAATDRAGRAGGNVTINAGSVSITGLVSTNGSAGRYDTNRGGDNGQNGGNGGFVSITALTGDISVNAIDTSGGVAAGDYDGTIDNGTTDTGNGGDAGAITLTVGAASTINLTGDLTATGARGYIDGSTGSHGAGNTIALNGDVVLLSDVTINAAGATDTTVDTPGSFGDVTFAGTIAGDADRDNDLTVMANAINFLGAIADASIRLGDIVLNATGAIDATNDTIMANTFTVNQASSFTAGTINTANASGTGGNISITADQITLNDDLNASGTTDGMVDLNLSTAGSVTLARTTDFTSNVILTGSAGTDTLNAANRDNNWVINGSDSTLNGNNFTFNGIENLIGNNGRDDFTIGNTGSAAQIDGGAGSGLNTLTGRDTATTWTLSPTESSLADSNTYVGEFSNIDTLNGGDAVDTFDISRDFTGIINGGLATVGDIFNFLAGLSGIDYTGIINAGDGDDRFNIEGTNIAFNNALNGGGGNDILVAANEANFWSITNADSGTIYAESALDTRRIAFNNIEHLEGGTVEDTFNIGADITGSIAGNEGNDTFNLTSNVTGTINGNADNDTFNLNTTVGTQLNGDTGNDTLTVLADNVSATFAGGDGGTDIDTVAGYDSANTNVWTIDSNGGGNLVNGLGIITFSETENVTGGTGVDDFTLTSAGEIARIDGGGGIDTLTARDAANTWTLSSTVTQLAVTAGNRYVDLIERIETLTGGNDVDIFDISRDFVGTINGGDNNDEFNINTNVSAEINGGRGNDIFNVTTSTSGQLNGGDDNDVLNVLADNIILNFFGGDGGTTNVDTVNGFDSPQTNIWNIDSTASGTLQNSTATNIVFSGTENLVGGTGDDDFTISASGTMASIDGGDGTGIDTLTARNVNNTWTIANGANTLALTSSGVYLNNFSNFEILTGGGAADIFNINADFTGTINGDPLAGLGEDVFNINSASGFSGTANGMGGVDDFNIVQAMAGTLNGDGGDDRFTVLQTGLTTINQLNGGTSAETNGDTLTAADAANYWLINGNASGSLYTSANDRTNSNAEQLNFNEFETIIGGSAADDFLVDGSGSMQNIDGAAGVNQLTARNSANEWAVNGVNSGGLYVDNNAAGVGTAYVNNFVNVQNLVGGSGTDRFVMGATGVIASLDGGSGDNTLVARQGVVNIWNFLTDISGSLTQTGQASTYVNAFNNMKSYVGGGVGNEWADFSGAGTVNVNVDNYFGFTGVIGNNTSSNLYGQNDTNTPNEWLVTAVTNQGGVQTDGQNDGTFSNGNTTTALRFIDFNNLIGGDGVDNFVIDTTGSIAQIDGGTGADTLTARDVDNTWTLAATNSLAATSGGPAYVGTFSNLETLTGGGAADTFNINTDFTGTINGDPLAGLGEDVFNINSANGFSGTANGVGGADDFNIVQAMAGTLNGGDGNDTFGINANVTGTLNGDGGDDRFTLLQTGLTTINQLNGGTSNETNGDTLTAADAANYWLINGNASGSLYTSANDRTNSNAEQLSFNEFETIIGGSAADDFLVDNSGTIQQIDGAAGVNQLTARNSANEWAVNGVNSGGLYVDNNAAGVGTAYVNNFVNVQNLVGGSGTDRFVMGATGVIASLDGGSGDNTLVARQGVVNIWNFLTDISGSLTQTGQASRYVNAFNNMKSYVGGGAGNEWADFSGAGTVNVNVDNYFGFTGVIGNNTNSNLYGQNDTNTPNEWLVTAVTNQGGVQTDGQNDGTFSNGNTTTALRFIDFNNLMGGDGVDNFVIASTGSVSQIDGGTGADTLTARDGTNSWTLAATNSLAVSGGATYVGTFNNLETLIGGSDVDIFTLDAINFTGLINGGAGNDRLTITAAGDRTIELGNRINNNQNVVQIEDISANAAVTNELIGDRTATTNNWTISGARNGDVSDGTTTTVYNNIDQLTGGANTDNFDLATNAYAGIINGGDGIDQLTISANGNQIVEIGNRSNGNINVFQLETLIANQASTINELIGDSDATVSSWTINGPDTGTLDDGTNTLSFSNFTDLTGTGGTDNVSITGDVTAGLTGVIDGMGGNDNLTITASGDRTIEIGNRNGGALANGRQYIDQLETLTANAASSNTLISDSAATTSNWTISGARSGNVTDGTTSTAFSNVDNVTGGAAIDNVTLTATDFAGLIAGGAGLDSLTITAAGNRTIELGNRVNANQNIFQIETLTANAAVTNELIGDGTATNGWTINGVRNGDVSDGTTNTAYNNIDQVTGGASTDNFELATNAYAGIINGGGGIDQLTILASGNQIVEIGNRSNSNINVFQLETLIANQAATINELIGDSTATTSSWTINGNNAGVLNDGTNNLSFSNFTDLTGTGGTDNFSITGDATAGLTGVIDGMGGNDRLTITASGDRTVEIGNRSGGALMNDRQTVYRLETITANSADTNELISDRAAGANAWRVTSTDLGTVTGSISPVSFNNFATLTEGSLSGDFIIEADAGVNVINGGAGNDTFTLFGSVQTLNAGDGNDVITLNTGSAVLTLNAGDGNDTITANAGASAGTVNGDDGEDRFFIRADLAAAIFNGGADDDYFSVESSTASALFISDVALNGDGGSDTFEVGELTTSAPQESTLTIVGGEDIDNTDNDSLGSTVAGFELTLGDSGSVAGVTATEIEVVSAINGILNARDNTTTSWNINGLNAGTISDIGTGGSAAESLAFTGFVALNGGNGIDIFNVNTNGSIEGTITGGGNQDTLNIDLTGRTESGQIDFNGGNANDTITLNGTALNETYTPRINAGATDQLAYVLDGATFEVNYAAVDSVTSNVIATDLTINNGTAADTITLGARVFAASTSVANVNYQIADKTNITVRALGLSNLNLSDSILLTNGDLTITANAINDTRVDTTASLITANRLVLDNVNQAGSESNRLMTDVNELSVINHSGEIFIVEQDTTTQNGIELIEISNATGVIDIETITGPITSTANLQTSGALNLTAADDITLSGDNQFAAVTLTSAANITLAGNNQISGALTLNGETVNVNNRTATNLASVNAADLTITSLGDIIGSGAIVVSNNNATALARLTSTTGSITLNNSGNNVDVVNLQAANDASLTESGSLTISDTTVGGALNVTANGNLTVGSLTANMITLDSATGAIIDGASNLKAGTVTLTAARGIGGGTVSHVSGSEGFDNLDPSGAINTQTANLSAINTTSGTVNIDNEGALNVRDLRNRGDIILRNFGDILLQATQGNGASTGAIDANYGGNITSSVYAGSVVILNESGNSVRTAGFGLSEADITAESLFVNSVTDFGEQGQPIRLRVNDQFTLIGSRGAVISIGADPRNTTTSADLVEGDATSGLGGQQTVDIGSLADIDPAIFAEVRNYNYGDTSLRLPLDQRTRSEDEDEDEEEAAAAVEEEV